MTACDTPQSQATLYNHIPAGEQTAAEVMTYIKELTISDLMRICKFSTQMASRELKMAFEFPNKLSGDKAIEAFTGIVFKALDYPSLCAESKARANNNVRIISSLYGWLRPDDIIKQYRFDYTTRLAPDNKSFASYWRKDVTAQLIQELQTRGDNEIINLLPADAAACIDWKQVKDYAQVCKIDFKEIRESGAYKTPAAGKLKRSRGELLRAILMGDLTSATELKTLSTDTHLPGDPSDSPEQITFYV